MIGAVSSYLPSTGIAGLGLLIPDTSGASGFGPDFLVSALSGQTQVPGVIYDANGLLVGLDDKSPDTKARKEALEQAKTLLKAGDTVGARESANKVLKRNPADAIAAAYVGRSYLVEGNYREAVKYFARAASGSDDSQIQVDLHSAQTLAKGTGPALDEIQRLLRQDSTSREGAQLATYLLDANPENLDARLALANYYEQNGHTNLAGGELREALEKVSAGDRNRLVASIEEFNQAHQEDASAYDLLAQAYVRAGRLTEAQSAFNTALDLSGDNAEFRVQIKGDFAKVYLDLGRGQQAKGNEDEALRLYQLGVDTFSTEEGKAALSDLALERGRRQTQQGQLKLALESLDKARAYQPGTADDTKKNELISAYENLATKFNTAGDLKSVTSARYGAYVLDPANDTRKRALADAYDVYGLDLGSKQDYFMAARQFRNALTYYTNDVNYAAHLADAESHL